MDRSSPTEEDWPQEGTFCTLKLLKKADGTELQRYPVDGERTTFGRDPSNDVRIYYPDISRFQCELIFDPDRKPFLKVLGKTGVLINGKQVQPPAEIELKEGDTFEMRKKRWLLCLPTVDAVQAMKQVEASTPRRRRPSTRFSIIPPDLPFSPYATHDAAARLPASPIGSLKVSGTQSSAKLARGQVLQSLFPQYGEEGHEEGDRDDVDSGESSEQRKAEEEELKVEEPASKSIATRIQESIWMPRRFSNPLSSKDKDVGRSQPASPVLRPSLSDAQLDNIASRKRKSRDEQETKTVSYQQTTPHSTPLPVSSETPYASADGTPVRKPLISRTPSSTAGRTPRSSAKAPSTDRPSLYPALPPAPLNYRTAQPPSIATPSTPSTGERLNQSPQELHLSTSSSAEASTFKSPKVHSNPLPSVESSPAKQSVAPSTPSAVTQQTPKNLTATRGPSSLRKAILMRSARKVLFGQKEEPVAVKDEMAGNIEICEQPSTETGSQDVFDNPPTELESSISGFDRDSATSDKEEEEDIKNKNESSEDMVSAASQSTSIGIESREHSDESDDEGWTESAEEEQLEDSLSDEGSIDNEPIIDYADQEVSIGSIGESESDDEAFEEIEKSLILEISSGSESEEEEKPDLKPFIVKKEETSLEDIIPAGPSNSTVLSTPQAARTVQTRFYTPQNVSSKDFKIGLSKTMGPPVQIPTSASKPRSSTPLSKIWKEEAGRRSSLGPPLRVHRVRTVEEDVEEEIKDEQEALRKAAAKRRESSIILASAPRQLPKISEFDMKDLQSPRKKPLGSPSVVPEFNDSSSDEERTPLQLLAKKAEKLRKKSIARQSMLGAAPFSPSAPGTPLRDSALSTFTPKSSLHQSPMPLFGSTNLQASRFSARPEPPTPNMGGLRHLFSTAAVVPSTPRFGGMRSLFKEPIEESPETPHLGGIESMFQLSEETGSLFPESPSVVRPLKSEDEFLSQPEEPLGQEMVTENPEESLLILSEDSLLGLEQAAENDISDAMTDHEGFYGEDAENDEDEKGLQDEDDQVVIQASSEHSSDIRPTPIFPSTSISTVTGTETVDEQKTGSTDTELPRLRTRQTSARSTTTIASESESIADSSRFDISSSPTPPSLPSPPRTRRATSRAASEQPTTSIPPPPVAPSVLTSKLPARRTTRAASATPSVPSVQAPVKLTRSTSAVKKEPSSRTSIDRDETGYGEQLTRTSNRRTTSTSTRASQEPVSSEATGSKTRRGRVPVSSSAGVTAAASGSKSMGAKNVGSRVVSVKAEPIELETLEEDEDVLEVEAPSALSARARSTKARAATTAEKGKKSVGSGATALGSGSPREDESSLPVIKKRRTNTGSSVDDDKENETAKTINRTLSKSSNTVVNAKSAPVSKLVPPKPVGRTTRARTATAEPEEQSLGKVTVSRTSARAKK